MLSKSIPGWILKRDGTNFHNRVPYQLALWRQKCEFNKQPVAWATTLAGTQEHFCLQATAPLSVESTADASCSTTSFHPSVQRPSKFKSFNASVRPCLISWQSPSAVRQSGGARCARMTGHPTSSARQVNVMSALCNSWHVCCAAHQDA